jgi:dihydroneopterin aldolase
MPDIRTRLPAPSAEAGSTTETASPLPARHIFIRDLVLAAEIGAHRHERGTNQRIRINVDLSVSEEGPAIADDLRNVVCYDEVVTGIRALAGAGHVNLVETLAERIAAMCLADMRVRRVRVRVEKLDVYPDAGSVGVEIERSNPSQLA